MKKFFMLLAMSLAFFLTAEEGIDLIEDPSLLEEVYQEFAIRAVQGLRGQEGSVLVGELTSSGMPLQATVMFQAVVLKELLYSLEDFEIFDSSSFRGNQNEMDYSISGEAFSEGEIIFITLKLQQTSNGRLMAIQNFTIPADARWGTAFIPQVTYAPGERPDSSEPNDSVESAYMLNFPEPGLSAGFHTSGDYDFYELYVPEDESDYFITAKTQGNTDTVMTLYGPDDPYSYYTEDDDGGDAYNSQIGFAAQGGQTWWIEVRAYGSDEGDYTLVVEAADEGMFNDEPNNSFDNAFPLSLDEVYSGSFSYYDEGDFFTLDVTSNMVGELVKIYTDNQIDTQLYVYDEEGMEYGDYLYYNDDGETLAAEVSFVPTEPMTYYVMLSAYDDGPYSIYVEIMDIDMGPGEPNDTPETATHVELGEEIDLSFYYPSDSDYLVFDIQQAGRYTLESFGYIDPYFTLMDEDLWELDYDDDSGSDTNAYLNVYLEPGRYYLEIHSAVSNRPGDYSVLIEARQ